MREQFIPESEYEPAPALPRTIFLSQKAFCLIPGILCDLLQENPDDHVQYTWSAHDPFTFTCHPSFPTATFLSRLTEHKAAFEELTRDVCEGGR